MKRIEDLRLTVCWKQKQKNVFSRKRVEPVEVELQELPKGFVGVKSERVIFYIKGKFESLCKILG